MSRIEAIGLDGAAWEVRVCELKTAPQGKYPLALKIMKKIEVVRLKQVAASPDHGGFSLLSFSSCVFQTALNTKASPFLNESSSALF